MEGSGADSKNWLTDAANGAIEAEEAIRDHVKQLDGNVAKSPAVDIAQEWQDPAAQQGFEQATDQAERAALLEDLEVIAEDQPDEDLDALEQPSDIVDELEIDRDNTGSPQNKIPQVIDLSSGNDSGQVDLDKTQTQVVEFSAEVLLVDSDVDDDAQVADTSRSPVIEEPPSRAVSAEGQQGSPGEEVVILDSNEEDTKAMDQHKKELGVTEVDDALQVEDVEEVGTHVELDIEEIEESNGKDEKLKTAVTEVNRPSNDAVEEAREFAAENDDLLSCPVEFHIAGYDKAVKLLGAANDALLETVPNYLLTLDRVFSLLRERIHPDESQEFVFRIPELDLVINEDNIYTQETRINDLVELLDVSRAKPEKLDIVVTFQARFVYRLNALFGELEAAPPSKRVKKDSFS